MFIEKRFKSLHPGGFHEITYSEFEGDPSKTVICMHGLSRNGRDFDWIAKSLAADGYRVICPDMAGRGRSPAFSNPAWYNYPQYLADTIALIAHTQAETIDWVGTSMGGIIGMMLAAQTNHPIRRMVINDIGLYIPADALIHIKQYVRENPSFSSWEAYLAAFKKRQQSFGLETEEEWDYLARTSMEQTVDGKYRLAYDPKVVLGLESAGPIEDVNLWPLWPQIDLPILLLRGENSNIISAETFDQMCASPNVQGRTFKNVGHAPALMNNEQITTIKDFFAIQA